jgi:hypothetical protein
MGSFETVFGVRLPTECGRGFNQLAAKLGSFGKIVFETLRAKHLWHVLGPPLSDVAYGPNANRRRLGEPAEKNWLGRRKGE